MKRKLKEKISLYVAEKPRKAVLLAITLLNLVFFAVAALVISALSGGIRGTENYGFWECVFYTISMILDAGCVQYVVTDVGQAGVAVIIACLITVIIGMVLFTGAIIGYITSLISDFIEDADNGKNELHVSGHTVILNWNSRASEIINDLLYSEVQETVVVLVPSGRKSVEREIEKRIDDTVDAEVDSLESGKARRRRQLKKKVRVVVREGNAFSLKDLHDICLSQAKSVIILGQEYQDINRRMESEKNGGVEWTGNSLTVKTLIQVADICSRPESADWQRIVVETEDSWTLSLVNQIIEAKAVKGKCSIVPVPVEKILGELLSQFCIMPELNMVYSTLFSNKGAFICPALPELPVNLEDEDSYIGSRLEANDRSLPLALFETEKGIECFYMVSSVKDIFSYSHPSLTYTPARLNSDYYPGRRNIVLLGHNSRMAAIMDGFNNYRGEWNGPEGEIFNVMVIDDAAGLAANDYYSDVPYVTSVVEASLYDKDKISSSIMSFSRANTGDTSVLILSDDLAPAEETDAAALTYLIYLQHIIRTRIAEEPDFRPEQIDIIVEILKPENYDVVRSYSVNNIIISNRYISKMITQTGERDAIYNFYSDILTYDAAGVDKYESREIYIKRADDFFLEIPGRCTAEEMIRSVYFGSPADNRSIVLGYVRDEADYVFFDGVQKNISVELRKDDKLIVLSRH